MNKWLWFPSLWCRCCYSPNYLSPALPSLIIATVALPRSLQTLLLSRSLVLQTFPPLPDVHLSLLQPLAHQQLPLRAIHQPHSCLLRNLPLAWAAARMKPRMVSLAGVSALLLGFSDGLSFWLGVGCSTPVNQTYLTRMLYNYVLLLMLILPDEFPKALLSFKFLQGLGLHEMPLYNSLKASLFIAFPVKVWVH